MLEERMQLFKEQRHESMVQSWDEHTKVVAAAFELGQLRSWLDTLPPGPSSPILSSTLRRKFQKFQSSSL